MWLVKLNQKLSMIDIVIIGGGGNSVEIAEAIEACNEEEKRYNMLGFLDDNREIWGSSIIDYKVLGPLQQAKGFNINTKFINGIGNYVSFRKRKEIFESIGLPLDRFISIIHPDACVSKRATIGFGGVIFQNCTIGIDVHIGNHVIILPNSAIQHSSYIGDFSCVSAGVIVSGNVNIKDSCYIGAGAVIRDGVTIGENTLIGIGSVVVKNIDANKVAMGVPAREKQ